MKKLWIALLAAVVVIGIVVAVLYVINSSETSTISATKVKDLEKEGWMVLGTSLSLETAVAMHDELLETRKEIVAKAISGQMNMGTAKVTHAAHMQYAEQQADATTTTMEMEVKGELELSFMIYREVTNNHGQKYYEFQGFYTINPAARID